MIATLIAPQVGDFVLISPHLKVSGNGSTPWPVRIPDAEAIGILAQDGDAYVLLDEEGQEVARINGVYIFEPDPEHPHGPRTFLAGWIDGKWGGWTVTN